MSNSLSFVSSSSRWKQSSYLALYPTFSSLTVTEILVTPILGIFTSVFGCLGSEIYYESFVNNVDSSRVRCNLRYNIPENWFWWPSSVFVEDFKSSKAYIQFIRTLLMITKTLGQFHNLTLRLSKMYPHGRIDQPIFI